MSEPKYKVGDKVRVVGNTQAPFVPHKFKIGTPVTILKRDKKDSSYKCENSNGFIQFWVPESDLSPIEEQTNLVAEGKGLDGDSVATLVSSSSNSIGLRETILINGIKNMLRAKNASSLYEDCEQGYITDEDYQKEIEQNESKYVIDIKKVVSKEEFEILAAIVKEVNTDFTVDEVAEIFGLDVSNMLNKELLVNEGDASKADSTTVRPDNNSEKTMTSKDHSRLKEGEEIDCYAASLPSLSEAWNSEEDKKRWELEPKEQVSNWKERFSEEYAICSGDSSDLIKWIEENLINQKVPQVSNTDWKQEMKNLKREISDSMLRVKGGHSSANLEGIEYACNYLLTNRVQPLEQQLREANEEIDQKVKKVSELLTENQRLRNLLAEAEQK